MIKSIIFSETCPFCNQDKVTIWQQHQNCENWLQIGVATKIIRRIENENNEALDQLINEYRTAANQLQNLLNNRHNDEELINLFNDI